MDKIPVIGTAVVNSSYWVSRLIMSVDYPVENFVIINNNGRGEIDSELDNLKNLNKKFIDNIKVCHMPSNIGCSGAWNLIIKCYMNSPYWIIVNDDVSFGPNLLKEFSDTEYVNPEVGLIHAKSGDFDLGGWDLFLIKDFIINDFGLFDENLYPAYCEDADYLMRFMYRPINKITSLNGFYYHGHSLEYYDENGGAQTTKCDPDLDKIVKMAHESNCKYLDKKWGEGWRQCCPYMNPFNKEDIPISNTTYDLNYVRSKHLGF